MKQSIVDKINKLLALSESPNEFEASSALLKAQELMAKNNLSSADVQGQNIGEDIAMYGTIQSDYLSEPWRLKLATVICDNFRCYAIGRRANKSIVFLGTDTDVKVAQSLYAFTTNFIQSVCMSQGISDALFTRDYSTGFIKGLEDKFIEQRKRNKWEIVLAKPDSIKAEYDNLVNKAKLNSKRQSNFIQNSEAYERGYNDGKFCSPNAIGQKEFTSSVYIEHEYIKCLNEFLALLDRVPWMECFRMHPSYKLQTRTIESLYQHAISIMNRMENLELQMESSGALKEDIRQLKEVRQNCRTVTVSFYRAFDTPQSMVDVKHEYETSYREGISAIQNYIEFNTQITN